MQEINFGFFKLVFDDEKGEAYAYKNLNPDAIHDHVGEELEEDL